MDDWLAGLAPKPVETKRSRISAAPVGDVLLEQLSFLIEHSQGHCPGCRQCQQYTRIGKILLKKFGEKTVKGRLKVRRKDKDEADSKNRLSDKPEGVRTDIVSGIPPEEHRE